MLTDAQGLPVSTDSPEVVTLIDRFTDQLLGYGNQPEIILNAIDFDPTCVLANAHVAAFYLFAEAANSVELARPYLQAAQNHLAAATEREQWYVKAIAAWAEGDIPTALSYHEALADRCPRDLVSAHIGQYHYLFTQASSQGLLHLIEKIFPANRENHYVYGMLAFALEQAHRLEEAEAVGREAVQIDRQDPWAHHAVAHVLETQGRAEDGIAWMESFAETWENCGSFLCHNWWHLALYYLRQDDFAKVLELYDQEIWGRAVKDYLHCQINAVALLIKLELKGVDVGDRWLELAPYLLQQIHPHILPLADLHIIYGLVRSENFEQANLMLESIASYATHAAQKKLWADTVLPVAKSMVAHAKGDRSKTVAEIEPVLSQLHQLGGSHAQRALFNQIYAASL